MQNWTLLHDRLSKRIVVNGSEIVTSLGYVVDHCRVAGSRRKGELMKALIVVLGIGIWS